MTWASLTPACKRYLCFIYCLGLVTTYYCLQQSAANGIAWLLLAVASFFIAGINLRLPQNPSVVVSMGDVFTMVVLLHFGASPALATYWSNVTATALSGYAQTHGWGFLKKIAYH